MQPPPSRSATLSKGAQMLKRPRINPAQQADMDRMKLATKPGGGATSPADSLSKPNGPAPPMGVKIAPSVPTTSIPAPPVSAPPTIQGREVNADGTSITGANGGRQSLGEAAMRRLRGFAAAAGGRAPGGFGGGSGPIMAPGFPPPDGPRPMTPEMVNHVAALGERSGAKGGFDEAQPTPPGGEGAAPSGAPEFINRLRGFGPGGDPAGGRGFVPPGGEGDPAGGRGFRSGAKPFQGGDLQSLIADTEGQDLGGDGAVPPQEPIWKRLASAMGRRGAPMER